MDWQELSNGYSLATVSAGEALDVPMRGLCTRIREHVIPRHEDANWDHVRIELWSDSGRIIAFPSSSADRRRSEKAGCQVVFEALLAEYEGLADSELDDEAFASALLDVERKWIERFLAAASATGLTGMQLQFWSSDGTSLIQAVAVP